MGNYCNESIVILSSFQGERIVSKLYERVYDNPNGDLRVILGEDTSLFVKNPRVLEWVEGELAMKAFQMLSITAQEYKRYVRFAFKEELQRLADFVHGINSVQDNAHEEPWTLRPEYIPSVEEVDSKVANRDKVYDFFAIEAKSEELYEDLRSLLVN